MVTSKNLGCIEYLCFCYQFNSLFYVFLILLLYIQRDCDTLI